MKKNTNLERWMPDEKNYMHENFDLARKIKDSGIKPSEGKYANSFLMHGFAQLSFLTEGCRLGQCCFCTYGATNHEMNPTIVSKEMDKFSQEIDNHGQNIYSVLFDCVGSILDSKEFSPECFDMVLSKAEELIEKHPTIEELGFETHYQTLGTRYEDGTYATSEALDKIIAFKAQHPEIKTFIIELGLESANSVLRDNLLFKHINDETFGKAIDVLHQHGIIVESNVMATLPFLTKREQIEESVSSIIKALTPYSEGGYGVDKIVLFPLNVRENTFCDYAFKTADAYAEKHPEWERPSWLDTKFSIWSMVATLKIIADEHPELLDKVGVAAWFGGDRVLSDTDVQPDDWEKAYKLLVDLRAAQTTEEKIKIINELASTKAYNDYMTNEVANEPPANMDYKERAKFIHGMIKEVNLPIKSPCSSKTPQKS